MRIGMLALVWLLASCGFAMAASFDCAKAGTAVERAVCGDPDLGALDEDMAAAYAKARAALSPAAAEIVRQGQRQWLDFVALACTDDAKPLRGDYDADGVNCLKNFYSMRRDSLQRANVVGDLRFYYRDRFAVYADPEALAEDWSKVASKAMSVPQIDGGGAEAQGFNAFIAGIATGGGEFDAATADTNSDSDIRLEVKAVNGARISVRETDWWYGHGAAHGNYAVTYSQYLRGAGRGLVAEDIFAGGGWATALMPAIVDKLAEAGGRESYWEDLGDIAGLIADPARWDFGPDGISFQFEPYEVAAYAAGAPTAVIGWAALAPYLTPGARSLVGE